MTDEDRCAIDGTVMLNRCGYWVPAIEPIHFDKPHMAGAGLAPAFAKRFLTDNPGTIVGLVPCAMGGSAIGEWKRHGKLYDYAVSRTSAAMRDGHLAGILWHQGEADCTPERLPAYPDALAELAACLRLDLEAQGCPFVAGELGRYRPSAGEFNQMLHETVTRIDNCAAASSEGLGHRGDNLHFDTKSLRMFGSRYYDAWKTLRHDLLP